MRSLHSANMCVLNLMCDIIIVLLLLSHTICATNNAIKFAGVVENITVYTLENDLKSENALKSLKINISWMAPSAGKQPSSYRF